MRSDLHNLFIAVLYFFISFMFSAILASSNSFSIINFSSPLIHWFLRHRLTHFRFGPLLLSPNTTLHCIFLHAQFSLGFHFSVIIALNYCVFTIFCDNPPLLQFGYHQPVTGDTKNLPYLLCGITTHWSYSCELIPLAESLSFISANILLLIIASDFQFIHGDLIFFPFSLLLNSPFN